MRTTTRRLTPAALLHTILYGTPLDPDAAVKARIRVCERELAELRAKQAQAEKAGR